MLVKFVDGKSGMFLWSWHEATYYPGRNEQVNIMGVRYNVAHIVHPEQCTVICYMEHGKGYRGNGS